MEFTNNELYRLLKALHSHQQFVTGAEREECATIYDKIEGEIERREKESWSDTVRIEMHLNPGKYGSADWCSLCGKSIEKCRC